MGYGPVSNRDISYAQLKGLRTVRKWHVACPIHMIDLITISHELSRSGEVLGMKVNEVLCFLLLSGRVGIMDLSD